MNKLVKALCGVSLCLGLVACKTEVDLLENTDQANQKVQSSQIPKEKEIIERPEIEKTELPVSLLEAKLTKDKHISMTIQHSDLKGVQYRLDVGVCREIYPMSCDAKLKAEVIGYVVQNNLTVEKDVLFTAREYIQRGIGELVITDDFGRSEIITLQEREVYLERDIHVSNVQVNSKNKTFTVRANLGCNGSGRIELRNYVSKDELDYPQIQSAADEAYLKRPAKVFKKMKAVLVYKANHHVLKSEPLPVFQDEERAQEVDEIKADEPIFCHGLTLKSQTFKFSQFGITATSGLKIVNAFSQKEFEIIDTGSKNSLLADVLKAYLSKDKSKVIIQVYGNGRAPVIRNRDCAYPTTFTNWRRPLPPTFCSADLVLDIRHILRPIDQRFQETQNDEQVDNALIAPDEIFYSTSSFSAKSLGLTEVGMRLNLRHSTGHLTIILKANNELELFQAME